MNLHSPPRLKIERQPVNLSQSNSIFIRASVADGSSRRRRARLLARFQRANDDRRDPVVFAPLWTTGYFLTNPPGCSPTTRHGSYAPLPTTYVTRHRWFQPLHRLNSTARLHLQTKLVTAVSASDFIILVHVA